MFPVFFPDRQIIDRPIRLLSTRGFQCYPSSLWRRFFACRFGCFSRADVVSRAQIFALDAARYRRIVVQVPRSVVKYSNSDRSLQMMSSQRPLENQ